MVNHACSMWKSYYNADLIVSNKTTAYRLYFKNIYFLYCTTIHSQNKLNIEMRRWLKALEQFASHDDWNHDLQDTFYH